MTRPTPRPAPLALATALVLASGLAHAQFDVRDERTGIEGSLNAGYGALSNGGAFRDPRSTGEGPLHGSVGLQLHVGYRIMPILSLGLHLGWNAFGTSLVSAATDSGGSATSFGAYFRLHVLAFVHRRSNRVAGTPDLFLGAGVDFYASVDQWTATNGFGVQLNTDLTTSGLAFPLQLGFDYWVSDAVAVGVLGMLAPWSGPTWCVSVNDGGRACQTRDRESELYLFVGLGISGHFNLTH